MRGRQIIIGVTAYVIGALALLIIALFVMNKGLKDVVSVTELVALVLGAIFVGVAALTLQKVEVLRPSPNVRREGGRALDDATFPRDPFSWTSLSAIFGAAMSIAVSTPVSASENRVERARGSFEALVIDGDRDGTSVKMLHHDESWWRSAEHSKSPQALSLWENRRAGTKIACARCHHLNLPGEEETPCSECHRQLGQRFGEREVKAPTDTFDHDFHMAHLDGNDGCQNCHRDPNEPRTRESARACTECHGPGGVWRMVPDGATVELEDGIAPSYSEAMHTLCLSCHNDVDEELARCSHCHVSGNVDDRQAQR